MDGEVFSRLGVSREAIATFCQKWEVVEFALFGSVMRDDFRPDSDIDVMVRFSADSRRSLFDLVRMRDELAVLFAREVDMVERDQITNPFRRRSIERDLAVVYAA